MGLLHDVRGRNEFWVNEHYLRKDKLYNPNKPYKGNILNKIKKYLKMKNYG